MENNKAKITISLTEGRFEISGPELFVTQQIENFKGIIEETLTANIASQREEKNGHTQVVYNELKPEEALDETANDISKQYPSIYAISDDRVQIICNIPGSSDSSKTQNIALLYAYAQDNKGISDVNVEEIREICKTHACHNSTNFSTHIKNLSPKLYIDKGKGQNRTITLTHPGKNKALELLKSISLNE